MSIDRKDYMTIISGVPRELQNALSAHDAAQREALARVEAELAETEAGWKGTIRTATIVTSERDELEFQIARVQAERDERSRWAGHYAHQRDTAQAQLAEAMGLLLDNRNALRDFMNLFGCGETRHLIAINAAEAFLARHSQAEQQEAQGAQAGEFQREDRYIVIKRKDLAAIENSAELSDLEAHKAVRIFTEALDDLQQYLPPRQHLVIESDWPEYEPAWSAIQARVEGRAALATQPAVAVKEWQEWGGEKCPLAPYKPVKVRYRNGEEDSGQAITFNWYHNVKPHPYDIVAYQVAVRGAEHE